MVNERQEPRLGFFDWCLPILFVLLAASAETACSIYIRPLGTTAELTAGTVAAIALLFGAKRGAIAGLFGGIFLHSASGSGLSLTVIFFFAVGVIVGIFSEAFNRKGIFTYLGVTLAAVTARAALSFFILCLTLPTFDLRQLILSWLKTMLLSAAISPLVYLIARLFRKKEQNKL